MKKFFTLLTVLLCAWSVVLAVPAKRGFQTYTQSDGSQITVQAMGDEFFHYFITQDGLPVSVTEQGDFHYMTATGVSGVMAHNAMDRNSAELSFIEGQKASMNQAMTMPARAQARRASARPRKVGDTQVPTLGSPRVPILLVQYTDKKMCHTMTEFEAQYKNGAKSVYQYFVDQSNGKYTPQYDLYGIYDLPKHRAYYGGNQGDNDSCVATMVCHAIEAAGDDIDWSQYDNDGDGEADVCIVVYAGVGEAQASYTVPSSVWPCQWDLASGAYYGDGTGPYTLNGVVVNRFAVFNEISGSRDTGTIMDGIGTFCHEFSHCLGLPDFYATNYASYYGMGNWSLMDGACYNGGSVSGDTPIGYSAYEKNFMGWLDYITPVNNTHYTLSVFNNKSEETDQAIQITSHLNQNEYYILENRRQQGWDQYIPDEGVLITHFTYVPSRWQANTPNNYEMQLATVIPADNQLSSYSESGDCYGETNHELTPTSTPAMALNMKANGQLASSTGGAGVLNKPVTEIILNDDGTASLWYNKAELSVTPDSIMGLKVKAGGEKTATFQVKGKALPADAVLTVNDENGVFTIDKTTLTDAQVSQEHGATVTVTFQPTEIAIYNATIDVACEGVDTLTVTLVGKGMIESETPVMQPADTLAITPHSFRADWTDDSPVENVKSYTLHVNYKPQYELFYDKSFTNWQDVSQTTWWWTDFTDISPNLASYGLEGWTGENIFSHQGYMQIGDRQVGYNGNNVTGQLTSPALDLTEYDGKVTIVADAKAATASTNLTLAVGQGTSVTKSQSVAISTTENTFTQVLQGNAVDNAFVRFSTASGKPVQLTSLRIYAGEYSEENAKARLLAVVENGDSLQRVIEGITDLHYTVNNLMDYGTYNYYVEAVYVNDTRSEASNIETVTLRDVADAGLRGDVNNDGIVDIADVNIIINIMLGKDSADNYDGRAYVTEGDNDIDIADVNAVINIMLGKL